MAVRLSHLAKGSEEEAKTILPAGFEYVTEKNGIMPFRKPKRFVSLEI
jgi:hypothetical protein